MPISAISRGVRFGAVGSLLLVCGIYATPGIAAEEQVDKPGYLSPPDLVELMESSETVYEIHSVRGAADLDIDDFAELFWPSMGEALPYPQIVVDEDGTRGLGAYQLDESCLKKLVEAEPLFEKQRYAEALTFYQEAVDEFPDCYVAYLHAGDGHYFQGRIEEALPLYEKAVALNPYDFLGHFYRANALLQLERYDEALSAYIRALAMKPHRKSILKVLRARQKDLGIRVVDEPFQPKVLARESEDVVEIYLNPDYAHWTAYGICKAVWIGEPSHREERTGKRKHEWTMTEERQCLFSLLEGYYGFREDGTIDADPALERLLSVVKDGMLDGFVLYEIAYRLYPHIMLLLPEDSFSNVMKYVEAYVLVKNSGDEGSSSPASDLREESEKNP